MKRLFASMLLIVVLTYALPLTASEPLVSFEAASDAFVYEGDRIVAWKNGGTLGGEARAAYGAARYSEPDGGAAFDDARLEFSGGDAVAATKDWTIFAVVRADAPTSIGILSSRDAATPLVQLDYDEYSQIRFIVRDRVGGELKATIPAAEKQTHVVAVVFRTDDAGLSRARLTVDGASAESVGKVAFPVWGRTLQVGGLEIPGRRFAWRGLIHEVYLYDAALSDEEIDQFLKESSSRYGVDLSSEAPRRVDSWNVLNRSRWTGEPSREYEADVCVVGGGSAGCAAAIMAAREGATVVLIERQKRLGGTGANAFVSNWEGGPGDAVARELFERMKALGGAGVAKEYPHDEIKAPMGLKIVDPDEPYENSLSRAHPPEGGYRSVAYLPSAFDEAARALLGETGRVTILDETTFFQAELDASGKRVASVLCETKSGDVVRVRARVFVDSTGDVWLCRALGIPTMLGVDSRSEFDELGAPERGGLQLNAIARCYLIEPRETPKRAEPSEAPFPQCAYVSGWLDGPRCVNMLTSLPGKALIELGYDECLKRTEAIVHAHWSWLQSQPGFENYELTEIAPMLGIREGRRVRAKYVLRESDLAAGWEGQPHKDMIAVADHPCDIHGEGGVLTNVKTAYGVPYRCLIPDSEITNLLVACRGAGLSKIAASSCRLQRTMIQLGSAAGIASAWAARGEGDVEKIDVDALVERIDARRNYPDPSTVAE